MLILIHNLVHSWFMSSCSFDTVASSFLFQLYGSTCMAPYCRAMLKKEMVLMLLAVLYLILIMTDVMIPWRLWSSKNIFHLLLNTALQWDYHPPSSNTVEGTLSSSLVVPWDDGAVPTSLESTCVLTIPWCHPSLFTCTHRENTYPYPIHRFIPQRYNEVFLLQRYKSVYGQNKMLIYVYIPLLVKNENEFKMKHMPSQSAFLCFDDCI